MSSDLKRIEVLASINPAQFSSFIKSPPANNAHPAFRKANFLFTAMQRMSRNEIEHILFFEMVSLIEANRYYLSLIYSIQNTCYEIKPENPCQMRLALESLLMYINNHLEQNKDDIAARYDEITKTSARVLNIKSYLGNTGETLSEFYQNPNSAKKSEINDILKRIKKMFKLLPSSIDQMIKIEEAKSKLFKIEIIVQSILSFVKVEETLLYKSLQGNLNDYSLDSLKRVNRMYDIITF